MRIKLLPILICLPFYIFGQYDWKVDIGFDYPIIETKKVFIESGNTDIGYGKLNYYPELVFKGGVFLGEKLSIQLGLEYSHIQYEYGYEFYSIYDPETVIDATHFLRSYDFLAYKLHISYILFDKLQIGVATNIMQLLSPDKYSIEDKTRFSILFYQNHSQQEGYHIYHHNYFSDFYATGELNISYNIWKDWSILLSYEHNFPNAAFISSISDSESNHLYSSKLYDQVPTINVGLHKSIFWN